MFGVRDLRLGAAEMPLRGVGATSPTSGSVFGPSVPGSSSPGRVSVPPLRISSASFTFDVRVLTLGLFLLLRLLGSDDCARGKRSGLNRAKLAFVGDMNEARGPELSLPLWLVGLAFAVNEVAASEPDGESFRRFGEDCSIVEECVVDGAYSLYCWK